MINRIFAGLALLALAAPSLADLLTEPMGGIYKNYKIEGSDLVCYQTYRRRISADNYEYYDKEKKRYEGVLSELPDSIKGKIKKVAFRLPELIFGDINKITVSYEREFTGIEFGLPVAHEFSVKEQIIKYDNNQNKILYSRLVYQDTFPLLNILLTSVLIIFGIYQIYYILSFVYRRRRKKLNSTL